MTASWEPSAGAVQVIRSCRNTVSLEIRRDLRVVLRVPLGMPESEIRRILAQRTGWIAEHLARAAARKDQAPRLSPEELETLKTRAAEDLAARTARLAPLVGVDYGRITVRSQVSRWGSCSARGNLSFNCLLMLCPPEVRDYVVIHELCHRQQMNHSSAFWAEVERVLPDYREARRWLRQNGPALVARLPEK